MIVAISRPSNASCKLVKKYRTHRGKLMLVRYKRKTQILLYTYVHNTKIRLVRYNTFISELMVEMWLYTTENTYIYDLLESMRRLGVAYPITQWETHNFHLDSHDSGIVQNAVRHTTYVSFIIQSKLISHQINMIH